MRLLGKKIKIKIMALLYLTEHMLKLQGRSCRKVFYSQEPPNAPPSMSQFSILATGRQVDVDSVTVDVRKLGRKPQLELAAALVMEEL